MSAAEVFSIIGVCLVGMGLIVTWVHNGRSEARKMGALQEKVTNVETELKDENHGLGAIKDEINDFKLHCAKVSTSLKGRVETLETKPKRR